MKIKSYTHRYSQLIEAVSDADKERLNTYGCDIVDTIEINQYTIALIKMPKEITDMISRASDSEYQLGFSKEGTDFTDYNQQWTKHSKIGETFNLSSLAEAIPKIREWINKYGEIVISSSSPKKTQTYYKIFKKFGFSITDLTPQLDGIQKFGGAFTIS